MNRTTSVSPGPGITIDEIMSMWYGIHILFSVNAMPHQTKIKRKPRGVGAEAKAAADGESGVIIQLDFMEGEARQRNKQYYAEYGEGTAVCMRLAQPWAGSGRYFVMDSAFGSFKTIVAMLSVLGLFAIGMVKTAHRMFPKKWYTDWYNAGSERLPDGRRVHEPGTWKTLQTKFRKQGEDFDRVAFAVGWHDIKLKTIISSCGVTTRGPDAIKTRHRRAWVNGEEVTQNYERLVQRPWLIKTFFDIFGAVDQHDHLRQGSLAMEEVWKTHCWWHRIFATILGVIFTDCWLAYRYNNLRHNRSVATYADFLGRLAYQLINNPYLEEERRQQRRREREIVCHYYIIHHYNIIMYVHRIIKMKFTN
jgi:hypothetical protein